MDAPKGLTQPARGTGYGSEWPCGSRIDEQLMSINEIGGDRAARVYATLGPVYINDANSDVTNLIGESPNGERQLPPHMLPQRLRRFGLTGTNQKIGWDIHEHLLEMFAIAGHIRTKRPFVVLRKTPRAIKRSKTV